MLKALLKLPWKRMPHASTYRRVMQQGVDVTQLEQEAGKYWSTMSPATSEQLSLDGKILRGTIPTGETQGVHVLAVQEVANNLEAVRKLMSNKSILYKSLIDKSEVYSPQFPSLGSHSIYCCSVDKRQGDLRRMGAFTKAY